MRNDNTNIKFIFSKKATKTDEIFTVDLTVTTNCQMDGEDFVNFLAFSENVNFNAKPPNDGPFLSKANIICTEILFLCMCNSYNSSYVVVLLL